MDKGRGVRDWMTNGEIKGISRVPHERPRTIDLDAEPVESHTKQNQLLTVTHTIKISSNFFSDANYQFTL